MHLSQFIFVVVIGQFAPPTARSAPPTVTLPFDAVDDVGSFYEKDKVFNILPTSNADIQYLQQLGESLELDFWSQPVLDRIKPIVVRVPGVAVEPFEYNISRHGLEVSLSPVNVAEQVRKEYASNAYNFASHTLTKRAFLTSNLTRPSHGPAVVGAFASYAAITGWMDEMCKRHPNIASCMDIGYSFERRPLKLMKIGFPGANKQSVFIESNIHSREWIAGASTVWLMEKLLSTYRNDGIVFDLLGRVNFYVLPIANPDGYEYSRKPPHRYWRKTRSRTRKPACFGADPNRNFGFQWGTNGASSNPCSEVYQGPTPFSEPETKAIKDFVHARRRNMVAYFAIHSYGNYWLVPWGFSGATKPRDFSEMMRVARLGVTAITSRGGKGWKVGNTVDLLYPAAGGSDDWAKAEGIKYSYTIEMRPSSDNPQFGFVVESSEIEPAGWDLWSGVNTAVRSILTSQRLTSARYYARHRAG